MIFNSHDSYQKQRVSLSLLASIFMICSMMNLNSSFAQAVNTTGEDLEAKQQKDTESSPQPDSQKNSQENTQADSQTQSEQVKEQPKKQTSSSVPNDMEPSDDSKVFAIEAIEPLDEEVPQEGEKAEKQADNGKTAELNSLGQDGQNKLADKNKLDSKEQKGLIGQDSKTLQKTPLTQAEKPVGLALKPKTTSLNQQKVKTLESPAPPTFVEGELVSVGQIGLLPWDNRFGAQIGIERLGEIYYGTVNVGINHRFDVNGEPLRLTIGVPLRFELLDARPNQRFDNVGRFRQQDWDEGSDFAKVIQRLQYGSKEQRFFLDINRFSAHNLGHGLIMKRYDANLNLNTSRVGVQFDAFTDYIGFESMMNDITNPNLLGALVFVKPLSLINRSNSMLRSFSVGLSLVSDQQAPVRNALDREDVDNDGRRETELQVDQATFQPDSLRSPVSGYGIDAEIKLVDKRELDIKTYLDLSYLETGLPTGDPESIDPTVVGSTQVRSSGWAIGQLIRSNLGIAPVHALRLRMEYRNYEPNYLPSYFDSLYEIQRFQYLPSGEVIDLANATKLQRVFGRDPNGERVNGGYFEASWRVGNAFAFAFGLEVNDQTPDNHGFVHLEFPQIGHFQLSTTYHRRNAQNRKELFSTKFGNNDIWIFQTRYRTFSWLYNNLSIMTPFGFGPDSVFRSAIQVNLSLEIGFSYGSDEKKTTQAPSKEPANALPQVGTAPSVKAPAQTPAVKETAVDSSKAQSKKETSASDKDKAEIETKTETEKANTKSSSSTEKE